MPDTPSPIFFATVAAIFVLGGFVKGVVGLGLPTIAMGLLSVSMLPAQAAGLMIVPSLVTNVWQIGGPGLLTLLRRLATLLLGVALGHSGALQMTALAGSALALLPALIGMGVGQWLRLRVRAETFKTIFFCGLLGLGAYLAIRSALQLGWSR